MIVFKILNTRTGLWSQGGHYPRFSTRGKIWTSRSGLNTHLANIWVGRFPEKYQDCVVVEMQMVESSRKDALWLAGEISLKREEAARKREAKGAAQREAEARERDLRELSRLKESSASN
jgi:hypothetical protein